MQYLGVSNISSVGLIIGRRSTLFMCEGATVGGMMCVAQLHVVLVCRFPSGLNLTALAKVLGVMSYLIAV